jgi:putative ABC transport system permease protein
VLAALGTGIMLVTTVFLMQKAIVRELGDSSSPNLPNVFLIDISTREVAGVTELMQHQPGVRGQVETVPVVVARLAAINGTPLNQLTFKDYPKRFLQSVSVSYADTQPTGLKTITGKWWPKGEPKAELSVGSRTAARIHVRVGNTMTFSAGGKQIEARIVATHTTDGQHVFSRSEFIVTPAALAGVNPVWYGAVHIEPRQVGAAQRALFAQYPTVTVINLADAFQTLRGVVDQIAMLIRFLASFSIVAGCIILASSIASTRFRRVREVVVMKTLGATRRRIAAVFSVEFLLMGTVAGTVGVIFANLLARVLLHKLEAGFRVEWLASVVAIAGTAAIAMLSGWLASYRMLGQKPLEVLREE